MIQRLKCFFGFHTEGEATSISWVLRCPRCRATWSEA